MWDYLLKSRNIFEVKNFNRNAQIVVSSENIKEVIRSNNTKYFEVFTLFQASYLDIKLIDQQWISDECTVTNNPDWKIICDKLTKADKIYPENGLKDLITWPFGKKQEITTKDHIAAKLSGLKEFISDFSDLDDFAQLNNKIDSAIINVSENNLIPDYAISVEEMRRLCEIYPSKISNLSPNEALVGIFKICSSKCPGITFDQFWGFDPLDKQGYEQWPIFLKIVSAYMSLNYWGYRTDDQLKKDRKMTSSLSDSSHLGHAAFCAGMFSSDDKLVNKGKAIFSHLNIGTDIIHVVKGK